MNAEVIPIRGERCQATEAAGRPCVSEAAAGSRFCCLHADAAPEIPTHGELLSRVDWARLIEVIRARLRGDYEVDVFGFDRELTELLLPLVEPLNRHWLRVDAVRSDRVPSTGAAILACNHAGTFPLDGVVLRSLVWSGEPHRHARMLVADLAYSLPFVSHLFRKAGNVLAHSADATRLLELGELVCVFPEGFKGVGKGWAQRYQLQRFGRGGFVEIALATGAPIVPVAIVGSEEAYPMLANLRPLARILGLPYFPVTPTFPHLGLAGLIPLPSKWIVEFCEPISTARYGAEAARDPMIVLELTEQIRQQIQDALQRNLRLRRSVFSQA